LQVPPAKFPAADSQTILGRRASTRKQRQIEALSERFRLASNLLPFRRAFAAWQHPGRDRLPQSGARVANHVLLL